MTDCLPFRYLPLTLGQEASSSVPSEKGVLLRGDDGETHTNSLLFSLRDCIVAFSRGKLHELKNQVEKRTKLRCCIV